MALMLREVATMRDVPLFAFMLLLGDQPGWVSALALTIATVCVALFYRPLSVAGARPESVLFRRSTLVPVYLRQRDPDAAGRPRPRAPGI